MNDHVVDRLVVAGCCGPTKASAGAWKTLVEAFDWNHLPFRVHRFLPTIYGNLVGESAIPFADQLRGIHRFNWVKNRLSMQSLSHLVSELRREGVEPILIKGAAVGLLTQNMSQRVMGDVDLLVHTDQATMISSVLKELGYCRLTPGISSSLSDIEGSWVSPTNNVIDLHLDSKWSKYGVLSEAAPVSREHFGTKYSVLSFGDSMKLAAAHGVKGSAEADFAQACVDYFLLSRQAGLDSRDLRATESDWAAIDQVEVFLEACGVGFEKRTSSYFGPRKAERRSASIPVNLVRVRRRTREALSRALWRSEFLSALRSWPRVSLTYPIWLSLGMLGPFERNLSRFYLRPTPWKQERLPNERNDFSVIEVSAPGLRLRDLRILISHPSQQAVKRLRVWLPEGMVFERFLYVGTTCKGLVSPRLHKFVDIEVEFTAPSIDVSLRRYWGQVGIEKSLGSLYVELLN